MVLKGWVNSFFIPSLVNSNWRVCVGAVNGIDNLLSYFSCLKEDPNRFNEFF